MGRKKLSPAGPIATLALSFGFAAFAYYMYSTGWVFTFFGIHISDVAVAVIAGVFLLVAVCELVCAIKERNKMQDAREGQPEDREATGEK